MAPAERFSESGGAGVLRWTFDAHAAVRGPLVAGRGGGVYFVSADNLLHALDSDGHERFRRPAATLAPALAPDGTLYAQGIDYQLHSYSADGDELWQLDDGRGLRPLAVGADSTVYAAGGSALLSVSPSGALNWRTHLGKVKVAAATADGGVIAGVAGGRVVALWPGGGERWSFTPLSGFSGKIAIAGDVVYVGSAGGELYAMALDGTQLWRFATPAAIRSGPVAGAGGIVYFGSDRFYALSASGVSQWQCDIAQVGEAAPMPLRQGKVLLIGSDGLVTVVDADGSYKWGGRLQSPLRATPAGALTLLYIGADNGRIYAIE